MRNPMRSIPLAPCALIAGASLLLHVLLPGIKQQLTATQVPPEMSPAPMAQVTPEGQFQEATYQCYAKDIGITLDRIHLEFEFRDRPVPIQNLYVTTIRSQTGQMALWDALYSSDGDYSYWTTPVLRTVAVGNSPLIISLESGRNPVSERFTALFSGQEYPITCDRH